MAPARGKAQPVEPEPEGAQILDLAVEYEVIDSNPAKGKRRRLRVARPARTYLDRADQIESLLDVAAALDAKARTDRGLRRAMIATLVFAGPRLGAPAGRFSPSAQAGASAR